MIYTVRSHTLLRGLSWQLSVFLSGGVSRISPPQWLAAGVTDRPLGSEVILLTVDEAI